MLKPTIDCAVEEYSEKHPSRLLEIFDNDSLGAYYNSFSRNKYDIYGNPECNITFLIDEKAGYSVWYRNYKILKNITSTSINNFNSQQRKHFKKLEKVIQDFRNTSFTCKGCIYYNQYLLKGFCYHLKKICLK